MKIGWKREKLLKVIRNYKKIMNNYNKMLKNYKNCEKL